jgi:uncharacterized protein (DUF1810 family)
MLQPGISWFPGARVNDAFNLNRFVAAQGKVYSEVCAELKTGLKQSHWMWFIFPQIKGLGLSEMSRRYSIASIEEATAYLEHPVLGPRLRHCTKLVLATEGRSIHQILGSPDDRKFHSCMTLFARAAPGEPLFRLALEKFFDGAIDDGTLAQL